MGKINFNDKTYLNQNPSIADENKVKDTDMNELKYGVNDILQLMGLLSDTYNTSTSYTAGDRVIHNNQIYECISSTSGTWDSTKWDLVPLFYNQYINSSLIQEKFSTTETKTNKIWIDNKPIYRKVVDCGSLTNATTKNVNHGISNVDTVTNFMLIAKNPTASTWIPIPYTNKSSATYQVDVYISNTQIVISCGDNKSSYTLSKAIVEYTKTTD